MLGLLILKMNIKLQDVFREPIQNVKPLSRASINKWATELLETESVAKKYHRSLIIQNEDHACVLTN